MTRIGVSEDEHTVNSAIDALQYLILHLAKTNADNQNFETIFASSGIKEEFTENFKAAVMPKLSDLRDLLNVENESTSVRYKDFDWRLSMVTATRQH